MLASVSCRHCPMFQAPESEYFFQPETAFSGTAGLFSLKANPNFNLKPS